MWVPGTSTDVPVRLAASVPRGHRPRVDLDGLFSTPHGAFTTAQARAAGLSRHALAHAISRGRLVVLYRGVYAPARLADDPWCRRAGALLAAGAGAGAALCGPTAAVLHGLPAGYGDHGLVHAALLPPARRRSRPGLHLHLPRGLAAADLTQRRGLAVTGLERTVLDLCAGRRGRDSVAMVAHVLQRRASTPGRLAEAVSRAGGSRGAAVLAAVLQEVAGGRESVLEARFARLVVESGLPEPVWQAPVETPAGGRRVVDVLWAPAGFAVELDGRAFHIEPDPWEDGFLRDTELAAVGIEVMHVTWRQQVTDPAGARGPAARMSPSTG